MRRYEGGSLGSTPRIAVITNDALGNYVVATPLLQALHREHPGAEIYYYSGPRTEELWRKDAHIAGGDSVFGVPPYASLTTERPEFDLVVNVENAPFARAFAARIAGPETWVVGPIFDDEGRSDLTFSSDARGDLWRDPEWTAADLPARYPFLQSGFIGEIFVRLAYLGGPIPPYEVFSEPTDTGCDLLIAMSASLPDKLWPEKAWMETLEMAKKAGLRVGLLGAAPSRQGKYWKGASAEDRVVAEGLAEDLRGRYSLPQVVGALGSARMVLTLDNGIMHLAASAKTPTIALFRHDIDRLWTPPEGTIIPMVAPEEGIVSDIPPEPVQEEISRVFG
ncbi:hypothetical protein BH11ARM2_BH11ARM2_26980 [soil metagenome]